MLPRGATPIDFAYSIHTEVGHQCVGARVHGKMVPLRYKLQNGDIIEILTSAGHKPSRDWLGLTVTNRAKSKIRHYLNTAEKQQALEIGRKHLERELRRSRLSQSLRRLLDQRRSQLGVEVDEALLAGLAGPEAPPTTPSTARRLSRSVSLTRPEDADGGGGH